MNYRRIAVVFVTIALVISAIGIGLQPDFLNQGGSDSDGQTPDIQEDQDTPVTTPESDTSNQGEETPSSGEPSSQTPADDSGPTSPEGTPVSSPPSSDGGGGGDGFSDSEPDSGDGSDPGDDDDPGGPSDPTTPTPSAPPAEDTQEATSTRLDTDTVEISASSTETEQRTIIGNVPDLDTESDNATLDRINVSVNTSAAVRLEITQSSEFLGNESTLRFDRAQTYFEVSHPGLSNDEISRATFRVRVKKSAVENSTSAPELYRYSNGRWNRLATEQVAETETHIVYEFTSPGLSQFALIISRIGVIDSPQSPDAISQVEFVQTQDLDDDGVYSGFDLRVTADTTLTNYDDPLDGDPYFVVLINDELVTRQEVTREPNGQFEIPLTWREIQTFEQADLEVTVELWDEDIVSGDDKTQDLASRSTRSISYEPVYSETGEDSATVGVLIQSGAFYDVYDRQTLNEEYWNQRAEQDADVAANRIKNIARPALDLASATADFLQDADARGAIEIGVAAKRSTGKVSFYLGSTVSGYKIGQAINSKAVAIHLNDQYTEAEYRDLRETLRALRQNSADLRAAIRSGDTEEKRKVLQQRKQLLEELNQEIPRYTDAVHDSVIRNSAGEEDLRAYLILRQNLEALRIYTYTDYNLTTEALSKISDSPTPSKSLRDSSEMPTHGWQGQMLAGVSGKSVVYDTFETTDDYTVYRVSPDEHAGRPISLRLVKGDAGNFSAQVLESRPDDFDSTTGDSFTPINEPQVNGSEYTIKNATGDYYVLVRADGDTGFYKFTARSLPQGVLRYAPGAGINTDPVGLTVVTRKGPDIQRPDVRLVESPPPEELQSGAIVYPTTSQSVDLVWEAWDDKTLPENIQYRYRVDNGSGFSSLSPWRNATADGRIPLSFTFQDGVHRIQLVVRDSTGLQTVRNVDVPVSRFTPTTTITTDNDPEADNVFVRVLPERRVDRIELQYRQLGETSWSDWKPVDNTTGFGRLDFPDQGTYELRARAIGLAGNTGPWDRTVLEYTPPDRTAPRLNFVDSPPRILVKDSELQSNRVYKRLTAAQPVSVAWNISDEQAATSQLEYRYRVRTAEGSGSWSNWESTPSNGNVQQQITAPEGPVSVAVEVRDPAGNTNERALNFTVDRTAPSLSMSASGRSLGAKLDITATERVNRIEFQYREVGAEEWNVRTVSDAPAATASSRTFTLSLPQTGQYEVRARPTDFVGNTGNWSSTRVTSDPPVTTVPIDEPIPEGGSGLPIGDAIDNPGETLDDGLEAIEIGFEQFDGEAIIELYQLTRDGREIQLTEIEYTGDRNQTLRADAPGNLTDANQLRIRVTNVSTDGNETRPKVVLDSLRLYGAQPEVPSVTTTPSVPIAGEQTSLSATTENADTGSIQRYEWDFDLDGEFERGGKRVNHTFSQWGPNSLSIRVTDVFGSQTAMTTTIEVNAKPQLNVSAPTTAQTNTGVMLEAGQSYDPDGSIEQYQWDLDGDGTFDASGRRTTASFPDDGSYDITLQAVDNESTVATTTRTIQIQNRPPTLDWSYGPQVPLTDESVTLTTAASQDPDGTVDSVEWDLDGDGQYEQTGDSIETAFSTAGSYQIGVRITDDDGQSVTGSGSIRVNAPPNPQISIGGPVKTYETVSLNSSGSVDPDGEIISYEWDIDGDGTFDQAAPSLTRTYADDGNYTITLRVTDSNGATATANTTLEVTNRQPDINVTHTPQVPAVNETTTLDARGSSDRDGSIATVEWDIDADGTFEQTGATLDYAFTTPGDRQVRTRVTDDDGATNTTVHQVHVNVPPTAAVTTNGPVRTFESVVFDGSQSSDTDGQVTAYEWDIDMDGTYDTTGPNVSQTYEDDGTYSVRLRVRDDHGETNTTTATVRVENRPPNATAVLSTDTPVAGTETALNAANSSDRDGQVASYSWQFTSEGEFSAGAATTTYEYGQYGTKTATVRVTDDDGATDTASVGFYVNAPPEPRFSLPDEVLTYAEVELTAENSSDPDGSITTVKWDTDADGTFEDTGPSSVSYQDDGEYPITVQVTDNNGTTRTLTKTVTVANRDPGINVSYQPQIPIPEETVTFDATASSDRDGSILTVEWDFDDKVDIEQTGPTAEYQFSSPGDKLVQAYATDDDGAMNTTVFTVPVNAPPTAVVGTNAPVNTSETVTLDATQSSDSDGRVTTYEWDVDDDGTFERSGPTTSRQFADDGVYNVTLRVTDNESATDTRETVVIVDNRPPTAVINQSLDEPDDDTPTAGDTLTFDANLSADPDGTIASYEWDLDGDGTFERAGRTVARDFENAGNYTVRLRTTDDDGASRTVSGTVEIESDADESDEGDRSVVELWNVSTDGDYGDGVVYGPVVTDGTVYVGSNGDSGVMVAALDAATGTEQWRFFTDGRFSDLPVVADGTVYLSLRSGRVYALDADTGSERWHVSLGNRNPNLVVANGTLYVGSGDSVSALDAATGSEQWNVSPGSSGPSPDKVMDGTVYVGSGKGVYALDAATGSEQWNVSTGSSLYDSTVVNGTVYVGSGDDGRVYALDAATGTEQWTFSTGGSVYEQPVVVNGTVYVGSGGDGRVYALDAATGTEQWNVSTGGSVYSSVVMDETVYFGSGGSGNVYAVDAATGNERWTFATGGSVYDPPRVVDGTVYFGSGGSGNVYAVDAATGNEQWNFSIGESVYDSPVVVNETFYVGSGGKVYALTLSDRNDPPEVVIDSVPSKVAPEETIRLDASESTDPDGDDRDLSYDWTTVEQPAGITLDLPDGPAGVVALPRVGTYEFRVAVTDSDGATETESVIVRVRDGDVLVVEKDSQNTYDSIQAALNNATAGDTVQVKPGTYNERLTIRTNVTLVAPQGATLNGSSFDSDTKPTAIKIADPAQAEDWSVRGFSIESYHTGIDAHNTTGQWSLKGLTIDSGVFSNPVYGIDAGDTSSAWIIENTAVQNHSEGIHARGSEGAWRVRNSTLSNNGQGVNAVFTTGSWKISGSGLKNNGGYGVFLTGALGNWTIQNSTLASNGFGAMYGDSMAGDWEILNTTVADNGAGILVPLSSGDGTIKNSIIKDNEDEGIDAGGRRTRLDAAYNYWGASDGPGGDFDGSGDEAVGNVSVKPFYTDESRTTLSSQSTSPVSITLDRPTRHTHSNNAGRSQVPGVEFNRSITFANGSNYRLLINDEDNIGSVIVTPPVSLTTSNTLVLNNPAGTIDGDGAFWIFGETDGPVDAPVQTVGDVQTRGVVNLSVSLVNARSGAVVSKTGTQPYVLGYEESYTQNSTSGTVEIRVNQSVLPRDSSLTATVYNSTVNRPDETTDKKQVSLSYDPTTDAFVGTLEAEAVEGGTYSVVVEGSLPSRYGTKFGEVRYDRYVFEPSQNNTSEEGDSTGE